MYIESVAVQRNSERRNKIKTEENEEIPFIMNMKIKNGQMTVLKTLLFVEIFSPVCT